MAWLFPVKRNFRREDQAGSIRERLRHWQRAGGWLGSRPFQARQHLRSSLVASRMGACWGETGTECRALSGLCCLKFIQPGQASARRASSIEVADFVRARGTGEPGLPVQVP